MPTIASRKYPEKDLQYISPEAWALMQKKGLDRRFRIVDDGDIQDTIIHAPPEVVDFIKDTEAEAPAPPDREAIKSELREMEVEFNDRAPTKKLVELLETLKSNTTE